MTPLLVLSIVERIEPDDTDREAYKAWCVDHGRCVQHPCRSAHADDSDLCVAHRDDHRRRQAVCARGRRAAEKRQLEIGWR